MGFKIVYQDTSLLVVDKAPGLLTVPGRLPENKRSLINLLLLKFPNSRVVHRLDQPTSGLLLIPQNQNALSNLAKQFQQRTIHKRYQAIVNGIIDAKQGEINQPLLCDWPNRPRQMVNPDGKTALTRYQVLEKNQLHNYTRVALYPITGRSHQLRVHMQFLGHAIIGDTLYGSPEIAEKSPRLLLHAEQITFNHPDSGVAMTITQPAFVGHALI